MIESKYPIIRAIEESIQTGGGPYSAWYVGISKDPRDRLFKGHNVKKGGDWWIYGQAGSSEVARELEDYFVNVLGTDGDIGTGDATADMIYAYKKAPHTNP